MATTAARDIESRHTTLWQNLNLNRVCGQCSVSYVPAESFNEFSCKTRVHMQQDGSCCNRAPGCTSTRHTVSGVVSIENCETLFDVLPEPLFEKMAIPSHRSVRIVLSQSQTNKSVRIKMWARDWEMTVTVFPLRFRQYLERVYTTPQEREQLRRPSHTKDDAHIDIFAYLDNYTRGAEMRQREADVLIVPFYLVTRIDCSIKLIT